MNGQFLILPVIEKDPSFGGTNRVVGFARVTMVSAPQSPTLTCTIAIDQASCVPIRNASFANDFATIPFADGTLLPAPVAPFGARNYIPSTNGMAPRLSGVALASALSPRNIAPPVLPPTFN